MTRSTEQRWTTWCDLFDAAERELFTLFHTRWMWRTLVEVLDSSKVTKYIVMQNYLVRTYTTTVCTAIRRPSEPLDPSRYHRLGPQHCCRSERSRRSLHSLALGPTRRWLRPDLVGEFCDRVGHTLRHPGQMLAVYTPVVDYAFLAMFKQPWLPEGSLIKSSPPE